jgi:hypothetical protein
VSKLSVRNIRKRMVYPLIAGLVALALMIWGIHVDWLCIRYDAGRPFWPCETPNYLLGLFSAPAVMVSHALSGIWATAPSHFDYACEFPLILLLWWFIGTRADFGLLGVSAYRRQWVWTTLMIAVTVALSGLLTWSVLEEAAFRRRYPSAAGWGLYSVFANIRSLPIYLWLCILIAFFSVAAFRVGHGRIGSGSESLISKRAKLLAVGGFLAYCVCVMVVCLHV